MGYLLSPDQLISSWLREFETVLSRGDVFKAVELFAPTSFWRDMVAFTWNIHTAEGRDAIREMLDTCLARTSPTAWQLCGPAHVQDGIAEAVFSFETTVGRGRGVVRLQDGRCWTLLTTLVELKGHEEDKGSRRPIGLLTDDYRLGRETWHACQEREMTELGITEQPYCLIIGAGHCGLALGARLNALNVPTLLVDRQERPSDTWRHRYETLMLNSPSAADHMPYLPYPENWPLFPSKDQVANWLDAYASIMGLDIWTGAQCRSASFDEQRDEWCVEIVRAGHVVTVRPKHLVFATGLLGAAHVPTFPGAPTFKGQQLHSSQFRSGAPFKGRRCVVIGADVSAHDICAALWEAGADVTMVQRSPTIVVRRDRLMANFGRLYSDAAVERGITPETADLLFASVPLRVMERQQAAVCAELRELDAVFYQRLEEAGFALHFGEDGTGIIPQLFRRGSGYYVDVGASGLLIDGRIKVRSRVEIEALGPRSVRLSDGSELAADAIIYATGFDRTTTTVRQVLSDHVADEIGPIYGYGSGVRGDPEPWEGESRNLWKPTRQRSLWFHVGGFIQSRFYSRLLALQIKAREVGIPTPVYGLGATRE